MNASQPTDAEPVLIKKYGNRRLYDTRRSGYITLEDLAQIVQAGTTVRVVDANSGKDLTRQVLTQVILEQQERLDMIPVELLHAIIRTQGTLQQGPFSMYLSSMARHLASTGNMWAQQMAAMFGGFGGFAPPPPGSPPVNPAGGDPEPPPGQAESNDQDQLKKLDELRDRLDSLIQAQAGSESKQEEKG